MSIQAAVFETFCPSKNLSVKNTQIVADNHIWCPNCNKNDKSNEHGIIIPEKCLKRRCCIVNSNKMTKKMSHRSKMEKKFLQLQEFGKRASALLSVTLAPIIVGSNKDRGWITKMAKLWGVLLIRLQLM